LFNNITSSSKTEVGYADTLTNQRTYDSLNRLKTATLPFGFTLSNVYTYGVYSRIVTANEAYSGGSTG
jgi:hypothetical protein